MAPNNTISDKKSALLAYKEKLLEDIKCYEEDIEKFRVNYKTKNYYQEFQSSDSEDDFPMLPGPSIPDLQLQQERLQTCLQATQELTSLTVLESEVNLMVDVPVFDGVKLALEEGTWHEVTAECRIDLVPFTITFYMHNPSKQFGSPTYRSLKVVPTKKSHESELQLSVLHTLTKPSDAIEVLRNYAAAYRSRRTTLAKLANKYANTLFMEPKSDGFLLKCADLLEVTWKLENKWSPVAPFHHKMKFDLEYMDEAYIKIITHAYKQLLDPSIPTDERTLLLAKIIDTCLQAKGPIDTEESDIESRVDHSAENIEIDDNVNNNKDINNKKTVNDKEVMAPPKSLPIKSKSATKKRSLNDIVDTENAKKLKVTNETRENNEKSNNDSGKKKKVSDAVKRSKNDDDIPNKKTKNVEEDEVPDKNPKSNKKSKENINADKNNDKIASATNLNKPVTAKIQNKVKKSITQNVNTKPTNKTDKNLQNNPKPNDAGNTEKNKNTVVTKNVRKTDTAKLSDINSNDNPKINSKKSITTIENSKNDKNHEKIAKNKIITNDQTKAVKKDNPEKVEKVKDNKQPSEKINKDKGAGNLIKDKIKLKDNKSDKQLTSKEITKKSTENNVENPKNNTEKPTNTIITKKIVSKNDKNAPITKTKDSNIQNKPKNSINPQNINNKENITNKINKNIEKNPKTGKILPKSDNQTKPTTKIIKNPINKIKITKEPIKSVRDSLKRLSNSKTVLKHQNTHKNLIPSNIQAANDDRKTSKIPQKKNSPMSEVIRKNMLRISPRKLSLNSLKSTSQDSNKQKMFKTTNIPRLMKKPTKAL